MSTFYNVVSRKRIGEKSIYHKIGIVKITKNGGWYLQLFQQPETDFLILPSQGGELPVIEMDDHEA